MDAIAEALAGLIEDKFRERLGRTNETRYQPVVVGPPDAALEALYTRLTEGRRCDWSVEVSGDSYSVPVLLVTADETEGGVKDGLSALCNWDYAVNLRDSRQLCVTLSQVSRWDDRLVSVDNATETIGRSRIEERGDFTDREPWGALISNVLEGTSTPEVKYLLELVARSAWKLGRGERDRVVWETLNRLLQARSSEECIAAAGLPRFEKELSKERLRSSRETLEDLAGELADSGFRQGREDLQAGVSELVERERVPAETSSAVDELVDHVKDRASTAAQFEECPPVYFRPDSISASWWQELTVDRLQEVLQFIGWQTTSRSINIHIENRLNEDSDEPAIVAEEVRLKATISEGSVQDRDLEFSWRETGSYQSLSGEIQNGRIVTTVPPHSRPITYMAKSKEADSDKVKVISLASFHSPAMIAIPSAVEVSVPESDDSGNITQKVTIEDGGQYQCVVYNHSGADSLVIETDGEEGRSIPLKSEKTGFGLNLEDGARYNLSVFDRSKSLLGTCKLEAELEEVEEDLPYSQFEALVRAHRSKGQSRLLRVQDDDRKVRSRVEPDLFGEGIRRDWSALVGGWSEPGKAVWDIDWDEGVIGDIEFPVDPRPEEMCPPSDLLEGRDHIAEWLSNWKSIASAELSQDEVGGPVHQYVNHYRDWVASAPERALWFETIALYPSDSERQSGRSASATEPEALLLSPLHPLRVGWHVCMQRLLMEALGSQYCPAAGLLDPSSSPGVLAFPIHEGGGISWVPYIRGALNDPYWAILWNGQGRSTERSRTQIVKALSRIGLRPSSTGGGINSTHAKRALEEVQAISPARSTIRIGVGGTGGERSRAINGILEWCTTAFSPDSSTPGPDSCEVYDLRQNASWPGPARLQLLNSETDGSVQWIKGPPPSETQLDIYLLNELQVRHRKVVRGKGKHFSRSPLGRGGSFRVNIRQDYESARIIEEGCEGTQKNTFERLEASIIDLQTDFESSLQRINDRPAVEFRPNQDAIISKLQHSDFLAATSSEIDPACFSRGAQAAGGYLWDYELPDIAHVGDERVGYYLIGRPSGALKRSLEKAVRLVTDESVEVTRLLAEVSRRGIPILRRFSKGGAAARGELGLLLAVRYLQDAFGDVTLEQRIPVSSDSDSATLILPVDSYWPAIQPFVEAVDVSVTQERPDLLVVDLSHGESGLDVLLTPVEVKFRQGTLTGKDLQGALSQADNMGALLEAIWDESNVTDLWKSCSYALLTQCVNQAFRVYAEPEIHGREADEWASLHERTLEELLGERANITVNSIGRVVAFDESEDTSVAGVDDRGNPRIVVMNRDDAAVLLTREGSLSERATKAPRQMGLQGRSASTERSCDGSATVTRRDVENEEGKGDTEQMQEEEPVSSDEKGGEQKTGEQGDGHTPEVSVEESSGSSVRERVDQVFADFVGNKPAVERIKADILRSYMEDVPHLKKNILLMGPPSTGKTELSRRIAKAMQLPYVALDGPALQSRERLFEFVERTLDDETDEEPTEIGRETGLPVMQYPPVLIFVDEVHLVTRSVQESLLKVLETSDRRLMRDEEVADLTKATFVFATTRASDLDAAFRSRCVDIELREYELDEVTQILRYHYPDTDWPDSVCRRLAQLGRLMPRQALEVAEELKTHLKISEEENPDVHEVLDKVQSLMEIDERGLGRLDREYLRTLYDQDRAVGRSSLLSLLGSVDDDRVIDEVEPFLIRLNLVKQTTRGRKLTPQGRRYVEKRL